MHSINCGCPSCRLLRWQAQKYKNQFYVDPSLPQEVLTQCPMFEAYNFCPHGIVCFLPHVVREGAERPPAPRAPELIVADLVALDEEHSNDRAICRVCRSTVFNHMGFDRVLPTAACMQCCQPLYCPVLQELVESLFDASSDDYQHYKDLTDEYRAKIPNSFRISFSKEAHRVGCSKFAWSLISHDQAVETLTAIQRELPQLDMETIVSVGASSGWVENLYVNAMRTLSIKARLEAYDEIPNSRFELTVLPGGPQSVLGTDRSRSVLLLCWPPFGSQEKDLSTMGFDTLRYFMEAGGRVVIYIGDESSTGDFRFHGLLAQAFKPLKHYRVRHELRRWIPQEMGMVFAGQDTVGVYVRR